MERGSGDAIDEDAVLRGREQADKGLTGFYSSRWDRATDTQKRYMAIIAEQGDERYLPCGCR
jgi:hypothetical protein